MYEDIKKTGKAGLFLSDLEPFRGDGHVLNHGAMLICRDGEGNLNIDFKMYHLSKDAVIILFPGDMVKLTDVTDNFLAEVLRYDRALLREAGLQLEHTIYIHLRRERCRPTSPTDAQMITNIVNSMFGLLRLYFEQAECRCKDHLVLCQLKSFFMGFYDYVNRHSTTTPPEVDAGRSNELFGAFMDLLERDYKDVQKVADYAAKLNISPKYLNAISREISGQSPKAVIDHYVILQIKLALRTSDISIKELAWQYHFSDTSFFCRRFRQRTGLTPQEYRKKYREE